MKIVCRLTVASLLVLCAAAASFAQEGDLSLDKARVGEPYQQSIPKFLAEKRLKLESGSQAPAFEWTPAESLPPGLTLSPDGIITGVPRARQEQPYLVRVRVTDRSMSDAEPLELSLSLQVLAPRVRLVRDNAVRLVPMDGAAGQAAANGATPEAATPGGAEGNGNGASALPARVAAQPETPQPTPAPAGTGAVENAAPRANVAPTPQVQPTPVGRPAVNINEYISVFEQTGAGGKYLLNASRQVMSATEQVVNKNLNNLPVPVPNQPDVLDQLRRLNFRLRADRESTIATHMSKAPSQGGAIQGLKFRVSAELVQEDGTVPVSVVGDPVGTTPTQSAASFTPGALQAELELEGSSASVNLKQANAKAGDTLRVIVDAFAPDPSNTNTSRLVGTHSFDIELTDFGWEMGVSPSVFLLNRQRVSRDDTQPLPGESSNPIDPVNYSPFPGVNFTFTYKGNDREKESRWKFLQPGFGVNATFLNFDDETVNLQNLNLQTIQTQILRDRSDVQLGLGAVLTLFGNRMQLTYGGNLSVDRKRAYFGVGLDFLKLLGILQ